MSQKHSGVYCLLKTSQPWEFEYLVIILFKAHLRPFVSYFSLKCFSTVLVSASLLKKSFFLYYEKVLIPEGNVCLLSICGYLSFLGRYRSVLQILSKLLKIALLRQMIVTLYFSLWDNDISL